MTNERNIFHIQVLRHNVESSYEQSSKNKQHIKYIFQDIHITLQYNISKLYKQGEVTSIILP